MVLAYGQVTVEGLINVKTGGVFYSAMSVNILASGLFQIEGDLTLDADITGENLLQLEPSASIISNAGTLTLANNTQEVITNLTIGDSGFVEVPAGHSLTLLGVLDNANNRGVKLFADSTGYAQLLTKGTTTGAGTVYAEQYFTANTIAGWRQIGSPVASTFAQVDDDFQTYYPNSPGTVGIANQWNIKYWEAISSSGNAAGLPANGWQTVDNNGVTFGAASGGAGYTLYTGGLFDVFNNGILDVEGLVGNGDYTYFTFPTTTTLQQSIENTGWNLIPNPYPSNIDASQLLSDGTNFNLAYKAIHIWDAKTQQYLAVTNDVAIIIGNKFDTTYNIAPFQAFWVKGDVSSTQSFTIKNIHRTIAAKGNFFKTAPQLIRLNAVAANGDVDQTILTFEEGESDRIENRDAFKIKSMDDSKPNLYTLVDGSAMSINRLSIPSPSKHVPIYFELKDERDFTIDMVEETVELGWMIELEDHKTGAICNLRSSAYTFTNDPSFNGNRFTVHINIMGESITSTNASRINIFGNDEGINVVFGFYITAPTANVLITNLAGQIIYRNTVATDVPFVFEVSGSPNMYIVHVTAGNKIEFGKIVI
jgi:hypothetical protein